MHETSWLNLFWSLRDGVSGTALWAHSWFQISLHVTRNPCSRWVELDMFSCWRQRVRLPLNLRQYKIQNGVTVYTVRINQLRLKSSHNTLRTLLISKCVKIKKLCVCVCVRLCVCFCLCVYVFACHCASTFSMSILFLWLDTVCECVRSSVGAYLGHISQVIGLHSTTKCLRQRATLLKWLSGPGEAGGHQFSSVAKPQACSATPTYFQHISNISLLCVQTRSESVSDTV